MTRLWPFKTKLRYFFFSSKTVSVFDDSILFKAWKSCIWISYPLKRSFIILKFHAYPCISDWDKTHCKCKNMNIFFQFLSVANIALCLTIFHRKWFELTFAILLIQWRCILVHSTIPIDDYKITPLVSTVYLNNMHVKYPGNEACD